jgi:hypothetical protein
VGIGVAILKLSIWKLLHTFIFQRQHTARRVWCVFLRFAYDVCRSFAFFRTCQ